MSAVTNAVLTRIDNNLDITHSTDPEVLQRWLATCILVGYTGNNVMAVAQNFVGMYGRMRYIFPIYRALVQAGQKQTAIAWNNANMSFYAPQAEEGIMDIINGVPTAPVQDLEADQPVQDDTLEAKKQSRRTTFKKHHE